MASEGSAGAKRARSGAQPKPRQGGLAAAIQRYIREAQSAPEGRSPSDRPAQHTTASDTSAASVGQRQRAQQAQQQQQQQARQQQQAQQAQHVLPVVSHSQDAPNLYLQQSSDRRQGAAAAGDSSSLGPSRPSLPAGQRAGGAIAAAIAAEIASGQAASPAGRKRSRPPKAAAVAAASGAAEPQAAGGSSGQQRRGSGGGSGSTRIRLQVGSRARQQAADGEESEGEEEQQPLPRPRSRRRAAAVAAASQHLGSSERPPPHGCNMVLLSQLHATLPADPASTPRLQQRRHGPAAQQQVQAALQALEQAPRSPVLSPLQILMLDQSGSGQARSPLPLPSVGMIPLLQLPPGGSLAPGQTPLAAALLPAELEEMLDGSDFTLEGLLGPLPTSPYLPPAASLTPVVMLPGMAASPPATTASCAKSRAGGMAVGRPASPLEVGLPAVDVLGTSPLGQLAAGGSGAAAACGSPLPRAAGKAPFQSPPAAAKQSLQPQAQQQQQGQQQTGQQAQQVQQAQRQVAQSPPRAGRSTPRAVHLTPLVAPFLLSPSMALLSPLAVEQWLLGDSNPRSS